MKQRKFYREVEMYFSFIGASHEVMSIFAEDCSSCCRDYWWSLCALWGNWLRNTVIITCLTNCLWITSSIMCLYIVLLRGRGIFHIPIPFILHDMFLWYSPMAFHKVCFSRRFNLHDIKPNPLQLCMKIINLFFGMCNLCRFCHPNPLQHLAVMNLFTVISWLWNSSNVVINAVDPVRCRISINSSCPLRWHIERLL